VSKDVRFPLRLKHDINEDIDKAVEEVNRHSGRGNRISKHQFILDAVLEKINKQKESNHGI
jgi:hypothetical protein